MKNISIVLLSLIIAACATQIHDTGSNQNCDGWKPEFITNQDSKQEQLEKLERNTEMQRLCFK